MTDALTIRPVTPAEIEVVKRTVFPGATNDELAMYLHDCERQGVHPLDRLIHPTIRTNKGIRRYTPITSIDLMRSRAELTGEYAGNDDPVFVGGPGDPGFAATVTVYRIVKGVRCAFTATARWSEYKPDEDFMWRKMPGLMLGKVAEALALRKAFPRNLAGLYEKAEMDQADNETRPGEGGTASPRAGVIPGQEASKSTEARLPALPEGRTALIAELQRAKKAGAPIAKAAEVLGFPKGRELKDYPDADLDSLLEKTKALDIAAAQDARAEEPQDEPGRKREPGDDDGPVPRRSTRAEMIAYLNSLPNIKVRDEAMLDLRIEPMPVSRLGDSLVRELYAKVRTLQDASFDASLPF